MVEKQKPYVAGGELIVPRTKDEKKSSQIALTPTIVQGFQQGLNAKEIKNAVKRKYGG